MAWIRIAALLAFLGVAAGAFGAHGLSSRVSERALEIYRTGVLYHLVHALALFALALYAHARSTSITLPGALWLAGVLLFSGSLYLLALTGVSALGMVTPVGGLCFLAGWAAVFVRP